MISLKLINYLFANWEYDITFGNLIFNGYFEKSNY